MFEEIYNWKVIFQSDLLCTALVCAGLSSLSNAVFSPFIALRNISYFGEALSHVAFAGLALALLFDLPMNATTIVFVGACALLIGYLSKKYSIEETNLTTIFLSVSMALGFIFLKLNTRYVTNVESYLFGDVLLNSVEQGRGLLFGLLAVNVLFLIGFFKEIFYLSYNEEISRVFRIRVNPAYYGFLLILACNIVISLKIVGVILITAELVLPGVTALNLTRNVKLAVLLSMALSLYSTLLGFLASFRLGLPSASCIVIVMFIVFCASLLYRKMSVAQPAK